LGDFDRLALFVPPLLFRVARERRRIMAAKFGAALRTFLDGASAAQPLAELVDSWAQHAAVGSA
jgi:hypothetical protein